MKHLTEYNYLAFPAEIKQELIQVANPIINDWNNQVKGNPYDNFNTTNPEFITYVSSKDDYTNQYGKQAIIHFVELPNELLSKVENYLSTTAPSTFYNNSIIWLQIICGGKFLPPHIDASNIRKHARSYYLDTGGSNVLTKWWVPNKNCDLKRQEITVIPYTNIACVETACLKVDTWYDLDVDTIHSVHNLNTARIALSITKNDIPL